MTHLTDLVNSYLIDNDIVEADVIYNDIFPDSENECYMSRYDPSTAKEIEYIDGSAIGSVSLGYYLRSKSAVKCREDLTAVCNQLDNLTLIDEDGIKYYIESVTLPHFIDVDDKGNTIYTAEIKAAYLRPAKE